MNNITASTLIKNQITHSIFKREALDDSSSTFYIEERLKNDKIKEPLQKYKSQIIPLENELFKCLNLIPGEDIISEDMPLIGDDHNNYYLHLFRTAKPDPNKENFFFHSWVFIIRLTFFVFDSIFNKKI
jgi:hypothetical protein